MQPIAWHHVHPHLWRYISVAGTVDVFREVVGGFWSVRVKRAGIVDTRPAEGTTLEQALEHAERIAARLARGLSPHEENRACVAPPASSGSVRSVTQSELAKLARSEVAHVDAK